VRSSRPPARPSTPPERGAGPAADAAPVATKAELRRLRELLRDRRAREAAGLFVAEGPRVVDAAFDHGAPVTCVFVEADGPLAARARAAGVPVRALAPGAAARVGGTVTPQPAFALVELRRGGPEALLGADLVVVGAPVADPGNAGTLMRSVAAAGGQALGLGAGSVDAYNPKVVRASAGACFAIRIGEGVPAVQMLDVLGARGVQRIGAVARGGVPPDRLDLTGPVAFVLGHEAHGLDPALPLDELVTIPMAAGESLNVAMAGTLLCFEAARRRREVT
jgi:TrmH family RNA methyltransferase